MTSFSLPILLQRFHAKLAAFSLTAREAGSVPSLFQTLPAVYAENYASRLAAVLSEKERFGFIEAAEGLAFEMARLSDMLPFNVDRASPYEVRPQGKEIANPQRYCFLPYAKPGQSVEPRVISVENDVTLFRGGRPVIYDTKFFPTRLYGSESKSRTQLLKYNTAVNLDLAVAAVVEIKGWIHPDFLAWLWGEETAASANLERVQVISSVALPSGGTFSFTLKPCSDPALLFPVAADAALLPASDAEIVRGVERMLDDADHTTLARVLKADDLPCPSSALELTLEPLRYGVPLRFQNKRDYFEYRQQRLAGFWRQARRYSQSTIK
jgi:hypothetical protein